MGVPKERSSCVVGLVWDHSTAFLLVGDLAQATRTSQPARELQGLGSGVAAGLGVQLSDGLEALVSLVPAGCPRTGGWSWGRQEAGTIWVYPGPPWGQGRSPVLAGVTSLGLCLPSGSLLQSRYVNTKA